MDYRRAPPSRAWLARRRGTGSPLRRGVLKQGQVGDGVGKARVAYTSWGGCYFMDALGRELGIPITCW